MTQERSIMRGGVAVIGGILVAVLMSGCASGYSTVGDLLDANDHEKILQTTKRALESGRTGESINWENPRSGRRGSVTPTRTYEQISGLPCREFQQTVTINARTTIARDTACRAADGAWNSTRYDSLTDAISIAPPYSDTYAYRDDDHDPFYHHHHDYGYFGHYRHGRRYGRRRGRIRLGFGLRHHAPGFHLGVHRLLR